MAPRNTNIINKIFKQQEHIENPELMLLAEKQFTDFYKQTFSQRFRFEGDENFTPEKQRLFLEYIFQYGKAGVEFTSNGLIKMIGYVTGDKRDINGNITSGALNIDFASDKYKASESTSKTTAFASYDRNGTAPIDKIRVNAVLYGESYGSLRSALKNAVQKIQLNNGMDPQSLSAFKEAYYNCETLVEVPGTTDLANMGVEPNTALADVNTKLLDTIGASRYNLSEFEATVAFIKQNASELLGLRSNSNFKRERNITAEFTWTDIQFHLIESYLLTMFSNFIESYKELTNKPLVLINVIDERIESLSMLKQSHTSAEVDPTDAIDEETGGEE